jgi:general secretion pathway protein H
MRTSATGAEAGFTLVELMVVVTIIGLMATAVILSAPGRRTLSAEAEQFAARLVHAQQEAVLSNRPVAVQVTTEGYHFRVRRNGDWGPLEEGSLEGSDKALISFEPTGASEPSVVSLSRQAERLRVSVGASGRVQVDAAG